MHLQLSTRRVLVMEEVRGVSVSEAAPEEARREAAHQLLSCYYQQVLGEGFFHADPHPGNLRWADGQVWFLDFGMVGELEPDVRLMLLLLVMAFWRDDAPFLAETLLMLSGPEAPAGLDLDELERDLQELLSYVRHGSLAEIELGQILTGMARIAARHGVRMPASLSLAGKALAQVQLTAGQLDPDLQPVELIGRFVARSLTRDLARNADPRVALYELQKFRVRVAPPVRGPGADDGRAARPGAPGRGARPRRARALRAPHDDSRSRPPHWRPRSRWSSRSCSSRPAETDLSAERAGARPRLDRRGCARATARAGS